jgi:hypothetical protein
MWIQLCAREIRAPGDTMTVLERLQAAQNEIFAIQSQYRDAQREWHALRLVWESVRFAWYVCAHQPDDARAKFERVRAVVEDWEAIQRHADPPASGGESGDAV